MVGLPGGGPDGASLKDEEKSLTWPEEEIGKVGILRPKGCEELRSLERVHRQRRETSAIRKPGSEVPGQPFSKVPDTLHTPTPALMKGLFSL